MRIFITKWFRRFARRERISDALLIAAIEQIEAGQIDADLGGGVIKQRIARTDKGKSGGYRTLIAFRVETRAVFVFGFAKSQQDDVDSADLTRIKGAASVLLGYDDDALIGAMIDGELWELFG